MIPPARLAWAGAVVLALVLARVSQGGPAATQPREDSTPVTDKTAIVVEWPDGRTPTSWRVLDSDEQAGFDLGHAVFNTSWLPADATADRQRLLDWIAAL